MCAWPPRGRRAMAAGQLRGLLQRRGLAQLGGPCAGGPPAGERPSYCPISRPFRRSARSWPRPPRRATPPPRRCGAGAAITWAEAWRYWWMCSTPQAIVIGSIYARSGELLRGAMEAALRGEALPHSRRNLRILPAALGERLGDMAALAVAANGLMAEGGN